MKKFLLLTAALATFSGVFAKKVAFVVDMTGQTVSPNGVHVAGNFQGWNPSTTTLLPVPGFANTFGTILDINAKQVIEFKVINGGADATDWGGAEGVPAIVQKGHTLNGQTNDNRWMYIDSVANDTTVITLKYGAAAPTGKSAVRFAVDMQKVSTIASDGVFLAGGFTNWGSGQVKMTNLYADKNSVYEYIALLDSSSYGYKFKNGDAGWESASGSCVDGGGNRNIKATADIALSKVCFGSCDACPTAPIPSYQVTLRVDMSSSCNVDSVDVAGGLVPGGWGTGSKLNPVSSGSKVYTVTFPLDSASGIQYKFRYYSGGKQTWESVVTGSGNRELDLKSDTVLPANCFSSFTSCNPLPAPSNVTFKVDLTSQTPQIVYLICDYKDWKNGAVRMTPVSGVPGAYTTTLTNVCPGTVAYRFGNGADSTSDAIYENFTDTADRACTKPNGVGGFNRELVRTAGDQTLFFKWASCKTSNLSTKEIGLTSSAVKLYPNPTNDFTVVAFNDNAKLHTVAVVDITGKTVRTFENYSLATLKIERAELKAGLYFVNISNENNEKTTVKLMIQE